MVDKCLRRLILGILLCVCVYSSTVTGNVLTISTLAADYNFYLTKLSDYGYSVGSSTSVTFEVKACHNAYMGLLKQNSDHQLLYYIGIGTMTNTKTVLKISSTSSTAVSTYSSQLLDCSNYVKFEAKWSSGKVQLWTTISGLWTKIIDYSDTNTPNVQYIGITTATYTNGFWRIYTGANVETSTTPASLPATINNILSSTTTATKRETTFETSTTPASSPTTTSNMLFSTTTTSETSSQHEALTEQPKTTGWCRMTCHINYTVEELAEQIKQLKTELQVDKKTTSRHLNTLISAGDDRKSAAYIGYFGSCFLACMFGCVVLVDLPNLKTMVQKMRRNISSFFK